MSRPSRLGPIILALTIVGAACTGGHPARESLRPQGPSCTPGEPGCNMEVETRGVHFEATCLPVAEALVDVDLPRGPGEPRVKAITGIAWSQGVAVLQNEAGGCGLWVLALADGLTPDTAASIRGEVSRGVERFGVTTSPIPDDTGQG